MSDRKDKPKPNPEEAPAWHRMPERIDEKRDHGDSVIISNTWPPPDDPPAPKDRTE